MPWSVYPLNNLYQHSTSLISLSFQILEGRDKNFGDDDFGIATERQCLQRPPSDNQERCAYVKQNHKRKFMCFCKGDLCNNSNSIPPTSLLLLLLVPLLMIVRQSAPTSNIFDLPAVIFCFRNQESFQGSQARDRKA